VPPSPDYQTTLGSSKPRERHEPRSSDLGEVRRRPLEDLVLHRQDAVLASQLGQLPALVAGQTLLLALVDVGLDIPVWMPAPKPPEFRQRAVELLMDYRRPGGLSWHELETVILVAIESGDAPTARSLEHSSPISSVRSTTATCARASHFAEVTASVISW
jgi:hypothetical protein